jgi:hypothetical protein
MQDIVNLDCPKRVVYSKYTLFFRLCPELIIFHVVPVLQAKHC